MDAMSGADVVDGRPGPEFRRGLGIHIGVLAGAAALFLVAGVVAVVADIDGSTLTREPQVSLEGPLYTGILSNLGALVWMAGVVIALVGWMSSPDRVDKHMFLAGALVGLALLIDDFFLVHDWLKTQNRVLERGLLVAYFPAVLALVWFFRRRLGTLTIVGLLTALGFLGLSAALDLLLNDLSQLIEDGLKFFGICTWTTAWTLRVRPWDLRPVNASSP